MPNAAARQHVMQIRAVEPGREVKRPWRHVRGKPGRDKLERLWRFRVTKTSDSPADVRGSVARCRRQRCRWRQLRQPRYRVSDVEVDAAQVQTRAAKPRRSGQVRVATHVRKARQGVLAWRRSSPKAKTSEAVNVSRRDVVGHRRRRRWHHPRRSRDRVSVSSRRQRQRRKPKP